MSWLIPNLLLNIRTQYMDFILCIHISDEVTHSWRFYTEVAIVGSGSTSVGSIPGDGRQDTY